jgi:hypothetical protein
MSTQKTVTRNYLIRAALCAVAYIALTYGMKVAIRSFDPHGALLIAMAVTPALGIIAYFALFAHYMMSVDEYVRHLMTRALLIATGVMLSVSSIVDFLQAFAHQPPLAPFAFFIGFMLVFAVAQVAVNLFGRR